MGKYPVLKVLLLRFLGLLVGVTFGVILGNVIFEALAPDDYYVVFCQVENLKAVCGQPQEVVNG